MNDLDAHLAANNDAPGGGGGADDLDAYLKSGAGLVGGHNNGKPDEDSGPNYDHLANLWKFNIQKIFRENEFFRF